MSHRVNECGYRVVVTGEGSDELFGGYPSFKRDMLRHGLKEGHDPEQVASYHKLMEETNKLFRGAILSEETVSHQEMDRVIGFTPSWIQPWMKTLEIARPLLHDDLMAEWKGFDQMGRGNAR